VGTDAPSDPDGAPPSTGPTDWRKVVALASIGGAALGIVAAVVALTVLGDDEPDAAVPTTPPTGELDDLSSTVTTPPTLPPLTTPPLRDDPTPTASPPETSAAPVPSTAPVAPAPVADLTLITIPEFPPLEGGGTPVELDPAIAALDTDLPRRSTTRYQWARSDRSIDLEIVRDPANDRELMTLADSDLTVRVVIDHPGDAVYVDGGAMGLDDPDQWVRFGSRDFLGGSGFDDLREFVRLHHLGPVRSETIGRSDVVDTGESVALGDDGPVAHRFLVSAPSGDVAEWIAFAFGPGGGTSVDDADVSSTTTFETYVDESGALVLVTNRLLLDGWAQGFTHRIATLAEPIVVDLPDPALVVPA
jgi:hypothetical protein